MMEAVVAAATRIAATMATIPVTAVHMITVVHMAAVGTAVAAVAAQAAHPRVVAAAAVAATNKARFAYYHPTTSILAAPINHQWKTPQKLLLNK